MLRILSLLLMTIGGIAAAVDPSTIVLAADEYDYDLVHSSVSFKARHLDISWIHGRFNDVSGKFIIDRDDAAKSSFP